MDRGHQDLPVHAQMRALRHLGWAERDAKEHINAASVLFFFLLPCLSEPAYSVGWLQPGTWHFSLRVSHHNLCWNCLIVGKEARRVTSDISSVATLSPTCKKRGWKAKKEKPKENKKPCYYSFGMCVISYDITCYDLIWYDITNGSSAQATKTLDVICTQKNILWYVLSTSWKNG